MGLVLFWFAAANAVLAFLSGCGYLSTAGLHVPETGWLFAAFALWGQVAGACLLLGLLFAALRRVLGDAVARLAAPPAFALLQVLLLVDKQIFALFRFHWNGLVWNVLTTPGGWESMHISTADIARFSIGVGLIVVFEYGLLALLSRRIRAKTGSGRRWAMAAAVVAACVVLDHAVYAVSDLENLREVTRSAKVVPFYQPLTIKKFAASLGVKVNQEQDLQVEGGASFLDYPRAPLNTETPKTLYNIVWVVLDGWRADAMTPEVTPNAWALAKRSQVFEDHLSGGNATRFGIFSMFYGLYGTYWPNFLNERRGPVLIDRLAELGYRFKILSSTSLTFPEFRRTCFVRIPDAIEDELPGPGAENKDRQMLERLEAFLDGLKPGQRFFSLVFTDSTHAGYYFPKEYGKFKPYTETLEYLKLGANADPTEPHNRYLNAVHYNDALLGRLLGDLKKRGLEKDTIVLVTGDHGEEFHEHGMWGHNGNFSNEEIHPPLVVYIPGRNPGRYRYQTSHHDLVPTFMGLLGVKNPPSDYSFGVDLFTPDRRAYAVNCSWNECALIARGTTFVFSTESRGMAGGMDILDEGYRDVRDRKAELDQHAGDLARLLSETSVFLKK